MKRRKLRKNNKIINSLSAIGICGIIGLSGFTLYQIINKTPTPNKGNYSTAISTITDTMKEATKNINYEGHWVKHPNYPEGFYMPTFTKNYEDNNSIGTSKIDSKGVKESVVGITTVPLGTKGFDILEDYQSKIKSNLTPYEQFAFLEDEIKEDLKREWDCDDVQFAIEVSDFKVDNMFCLFVTGDADLIRTEDKRHMLTRFTCLVIMAEDRPIVVYGLNKYPFEDDFIELQQMVKNIAQTYTNTNADPKKEYIIDKWDEPIYPDNITDREKWINSELNK